ncbi:transporter substrate-binding domain-containing protein [Aminobacter sp. NyZ550]|nr:transporter substrate-binding domain-containing protein [Aminobacter sp. NyZ550]WAX95513.1 transporter substrate-binding domain-containing protein [Aminobacter sp. NyZ550]
MKNLITKIAGMALAVGLLATGAAQAGKIDEIRERGTVRIGVSLGGEPIGFRDAQNNPVGYDVDVATQLAEKLGVPVEFVDVSGDARISMLVSGQIDIAVANTSATLERAKSVDFSIPYNRAGLRIIVQKDAGITSLEGLAGKKIVVGRGSTGETFIKKAAPEAELVYTDNFSPEGVLLLQQKRVDAAIEDSSLLDYLATKNENLVTLPGLHSNDPIGIAVAKGDEGFVRWIDMFVSD